MPIGASRAILGFFVLASGAVPSDRAAAQNGAAARIALVDSMVASLLEAGPLPSFSMAVAKDGRVVFARAYGWANVARRVPADTTTRYRLASVSKLVTATAVGRLVQDGTLALDAPLARYVPTFPESDGITPRLLAGHLAGIAHYQPQDKIDRQRHYGSVEEALGAFSGSPRAGQPGQRYQYTTHGYTLLSAVVENAAGRPFLDYLATMIFEPLGMRHSGPEVRSDLPRSAATLYDHRGREMVESASPENPSYKWGGGGLLSTPSDMVRLGSAYLEGFISPSVRDEMWTPQRTASGESTGVGIGWRIGTDLEGRRVRHHAGAMGGARSVLIVYPDQRMALATTTNIGWAAPVEINGQLLLEAYAYGRPAGSRSFRATTTGTVDTAATRGTIRIEGVSGWASTPPALGRMFGPLTVDSMRIFHVRDDLWALVTPVGLGPLRLVTTADSVTGVVAWSPSRTWRFGGRIPR